LTAKFKDTLVENLGAEVSDFENVNFILQDGPCFPTNANVEFYRQANLDLVTITNTSAIDCAMALGLFQTTFVVVRELDFVMHPNPKAKQIAKVLFENFSNQMIFETIGYESNIKEIDESIKEFAKIGRSLDHSSFDHIEIDMPLCLDVERVHNIVDQIKDFFKLENPITLGVQAHHTTFNIISEYFDIKKVVKFTCNSETNQTLPELLYCTMKNMPEQELLVVKGIIVHQSILDPTARSIPTRILHKLGVNRFVIIGDIYSARDDMEIGDVLIPVDHLNASVLNSNTGANVDEWGLRFYDVSSCYDDELNAKFIEYAKKQEDLKVWHADIVYVCNAKSFAGEAEQRFCEGVGSINNTECLGVSFQGHSELMTVAHLNIDHKLKSFYIGIVFDKCVNKGEGYQIEKFNVGAYTVGIKKAMKVFEDLVKENDFS
jgi:purine nucleoside phosphorylase